MDRRGFIPPILVAVLALVIAVGGVGIGLAWRTNYLDKWLPPNIREMFGGGEKPEEEPGEQPEEKPETKPEEDKTKDWETCELSALGYSVKHPKDWTCNLSPGGMMPPQLEFLRFSSISFYDLEKDATQSLSSFADINIARMAETDCYGGCPKVTLEEEIQTGKTTILKYKYAKTGLPNNLLYYIGSKLDPKQVAKLFVQEGLGDQLPTETLDTVATTVTFLQ